MNSSTRFIFTLLLSVSTLMLTAQPPTPPATPIDGGLGILLAGGALYGMKKIKDKRKN